jgi:hypothetical protein
MVRMRKVLVAMLAITAIATSCTEDAEPVSDAAECNAEFEQPFTDVEAYPVFASSEIVVGSNRFLVALYDGDDDSPLGAPDIEMDLEFFDLSVDPPESSFESQTEFVAIDERRGLYQAEVTFPSAGCWGAAATISGPGIDEQVKAAFDVTAEPGTPPIGEHVPASDTPTASDVARISKISTDRPPDPRFYEFSIADALAADAPFAVVFATPKFCQSATCGPMLDQVKEVARDFPRFVFIHVEPYDLEQMPNLVPTRASEQWGLPSEPWVFVVDGRGRLVSKYEGVLDARGLRADLRELS